MLLDYHNTYLDQTVPFQADIGLFRINTLELKQQFKPKIDDVKDRIEQLLPIELKKRTIAFAEWIAQCYAKMERETEDDNI